MNKKTKVLVTGGAGFIGSHLVEQLVKRNYKVVVLDNLNNGNKLPFKIRKKVELKIVDIRDYNLILPLFKKVKYVFHFAANLGVDQVAKNHKLTMDVESLGMKNIVNACINYKIKKIIYASTSGIYGKLAIDKVVNENFQVSPTSSYAISKRFNEIYLQAIFKEYRLESVSLRFFNVYGPRQDNRMVIPRFFENAIKNKDIVIYGNGNQTRDFTFIDDCIKSTIDLTYKSKGSEIYNISRGGKKGNEISIFDLARKIVRLTNSKSNLVLVKYPPERLDFKVDKRRGNSLKLKKAIGYSPNAKIDYGLNIIYKQILNNINE